MNNPYFVQTADHSQALQGLSQSVGNFQQAQKMKELEETRAMLSRAVQAGDYEAIARISAANPTMRREAQEMFNYSNDVSKEAFNDSYYRIASLDDNDPQSVLAASAILEQGVGNVMGAGGKARIIGQDSAKINQLIQDGDMEGAQKYLKIIKAKAAFADPNTQLGNNYQFGAGERVDLGKDRGGVHFSIPRYDPKTGEVKAILAPLGGTPTNRMGLTAEAQVAQKAAESAAQEAGKLESQSQGAASAEYNKTLGRDAGAILSSANIAAQNASKLLPKLGDLKKLSQSVETGTFAETKLLAKKVFGLDTANEEELNAELMGLAQDILSTQSGTKTDFDFRVAVKQAASYGKSKEANARLINAIIRRSQDAVDFADQINEAMETGGAKAVMEYRFVPPEADNSSDLSGASDEELINLL